MPGTLCVVVLKQSSYARDALCGSLKTIYILFYIHTNNGADLSIMNMQVFYLNAVLNKRLLQKHFTQIIIIIFRVLSPETLQRGFNKEFQFNHRGRSQGIL